MNEFKINEYGDVIYDEIYGLEFLYEGNDISNFYFEESVAEIYNEVISNFSVDTELLFSTKNLSRNITPNEYHAKRSNEWFIPDEYFNIDLYDYFKNLITTQEEKDRVFYELKLFENYGLFDMLKGLIYLIEVFKRNDVVYGIGRGSSVSSYCLYLIGVHKINSIKYNLDIHEFLK